MFACARARSVYSLRGVRVRAFVCFDARARTGWWMQVPCCWVCNRMKGQMNVRDFVLTCSTIATGKTCQTTETDKSKGSSYASYRYRAKTRGFVFSIDRTTFNRMTTLSKCLYCARQGSSSQPLGLDRHDNRRGYEQNNVVCYGTLSSSPPSTGLCCPLSL